MRCAALFFLLSAALAAQQASVEGVAVNAISGEPLRGVHVRLAPFNSPNSGPVYGAMSDAQGRFSMAAIAPGAYYLLPELRGFVFAGKKRDLSLQSGQRLADFRLEMSPRAVITGHVVDDAGDPVQSVSVETSPADPAAALDRPMAASTDERGEYRLSGAPGKYYVKAVPHDYIGVYGLPQVRTDGTAEAVFGTTYYPGSPSEEHAAVVGAAPGSDVAGIDIRLVRRRALSVSGAVRGIPEGAYASVTIQNGESPGWVHDSVGVGVGPNGAFSFPRLEPGFHRLLAEAPGATPRLQSRPVDLDLETDVTGLELTLLPPGELTGKLELPGTPPEGRTVRLRMRGAAAAAEAAGGQVDAQGAFQLRNIPFGRFAVRVDPLPGDAYVAAVSLDGTPARDGILDLSQPSRGGKLKVTVALDGARLSGAVEEHEGPVWVFLTDTPEDIQPGDMKTCPDGKYNFRGLRPGRYRLFAVPVSQSPRALFPRLKAMAAASPEFEVKKGDRLTRNVKVYAEKP